MEMDGEMDLEMDMAGEMVEEMDMKVVKMVMANLNKGENIWKKDLDVRPE